MPWERRSRGWEISGEGDPRGVGLGEKLIQERQSPSGKGARSRGERLSRGAASRGLLAHPGRTELRVKTMAGTRSRRGPIPGVDPGRTAVPRGTIPRSSSPGRKAALTAPIPGTRHREIPVPLPGSHTLLSTCSPQVTRGNCGFVDARSLGAFKARLDGALSKILVPFPHTSLSSI